MVSKILRVILVRLLKQIVRTILVVVLLLTASRFVHAEVLDVQLVQFGTFRKTVAQGEIEAPGSVQGKAHAVQDAVLDEQGSEVRVSQGTSFGILVKFIGEPEGAIVPCTAKLLHPKFTDPESGRASEVEEWPCFGTIGRDGYIGYTFDNDWELVPGQWTLQLFVGSKKKIEKTFKITLVPSI
jgi:hypothetical protein